MRSLLFGLTIAGALLPGGLALAQKPSSSSVVCTQDGLACRLWVPQGYTPAEKYPLVIYLHGAGQRGTDNLKQADEWNGVLTPFLSSTTQTKHKPFVMAPQAPGNDQWVNWPWTMGSYELDKVPESPSLKKVRAILATVRGQYNIDADRIYVVGFSMGGYGAWDMIARTPDLFAGGAPNAGGAAPGAAPTMRNMAVWAAHNADDTAVPPGSDREMFRALARAGGRPIYTEGASGSHADNHRGGSTMVDWLFAQRRGQATQAFPQLSFNPPGGSSPGPVSITLTSSLNGAMIRYTTDGTVPTPTTGTLYAGPVMLSASAIVTAIAVTGQGSNQVTVHHAQPYVIGGAPLPDGAALGPADAGAAPDVALLEAGTTPPPLADAAAPTGGRAGSGGAAGASGTGGAGGRAAGGAGGAAPSTGGGGGGSTSAGTGGSTSAGTGGSGGAPAGGAAGPASTADGGGCSCSLTSTGDRGAGWSLFALVAVLFFARRRRRA